MGENAILFDGSRCVACQACAIACKERSWLPLAAEPGNEPVADAYERPADLDGSTLLAIALTEREVSGRGLVWEAARRGCVRCAEPPCGQVCPTGALEIVEGAGLLGPAADRCVSCGLCAMVCPVGAPHGSGERGPVRLCDGCANLVANGEMPACVAACPVDALTFGQREEVLERAQERAAVLRERGWDRASVLGASEQGGHGIVQVLKYGAEGHLNEAFATAGEIPWIAAARMAGPVSLAVLAAGAAGATVALAREANRLRRERSEAVRTPLAMAAEGASWWPVAEEGAGISPAPTVEGTAADGTDGPSAGSALDVALRKREALRPPLRQPQQGRSRILSPLPSRVVRLAPRAMPPGARRWKTTVLPEAPVHPAVRARARSLTRTPPAGYLWLTSAAPPARSLWLTSWGTRGRFPLSPLPMAGRPSLPGR